MLRVVHFEISADNPERAGKFYADLFGWDIKKWEGGDKPYWLVTTGPNEEPGINGGIFQRLGPVNHVNTIEVPDIDAYIQKALDNGGQIALPKMAVPGIGWLAYCKDTEDNIFGITQPDPGAC